LTDLPNRRLLREHLDQAITRARRSASLLAVLFLDLDHFKEVNDTLGHAAGDELLKAVARRLRRSLRESDTVARLGGDEFAVILTDALRPADVGNFARKVLDLLDRPFRILGRRVSMRASMGISLYPSDGQDAERLLRNADIAMYRAKQQGRD